MFLTEGIIDFIQLIDVYGLYSAPVSNDKCINTGCTGKDNDTNCLNSPCPDDLGSNRQC
jgi:hypothetical protein